MHTEDPFYEGVSVKDIPLNDMTEFSLMEDLDGVHIHPWGESVKPQSRLQASIRSYPTNAIFKFRRKENWVPTVCHPRSIR